MSKKFSAIIIGGGFSGLILAERLSLSLGGDNVAIIEKNERLGKKIPSTGNGRCNLTNKRLSPQNYHSRNGANVEYALGQFDNFSLINYFSELGILTTFEGDKAYPSGFQASSIVDALRFKLSYLGTNIFTGIACTGIEKQGQTFAVHTGDETFLADRVILCCGGKSGKQYGTDGTAFELAKNLGHTITKLSPSLVQLKTEALQIKGLKGIKQVAEVIAFDGNKELARFTGDVLFTDFGISGNAIFFVSAYLVDAVKPNVKISFLPDISEEELTKFIATKMSKLPYIDKSELLSGILHKQVGKSIISTFNATAISPQKLATAIKNFNLKITGTLGFDYSQVTRGGVDFSEINAENFMSKKCDGLYIVGEMLDVDGDCGGYNLQWAYSSARCSAKYIIQSFDKNEV